MSWNPAIEPLCPDAGQVDSIATLIIPRAHDLGGFEVRRALPAPARQMVGPFIFFDHVGPAEFITGSGVDVRPHPHIGLGTVTYLYRGEFQHRDSLGTNQIILPGAVNWMVAGHGVTHSERTSVETRKGPHSLYGIQTWVALPDDAEDVEPSFEHHGKEALPFLENEGVRLRLILGRAYGESAPVSTFSEMFYGDVVMAAGAALPLPDDHEDRGVYVTEGAVTVAGQSFPSGQMMVFRPGDRIALKAGEQGARIMILGGATLGGPRYIWWNFVASTRERIEQAKADWRAGKWQDGRFALPPGDTDEFIPLPEERSQRSRGGRADLRS
jgi:redox-sensitive bicupin YhaK (pirin superfamily)